MNKLCLITGSTQGIGLSIAEKLGDNGNKVIISSRNEENSYKAEEVLNSKNIDYDYFMCNFDSKPHRKQLVNYINDKYGKLDSLILTISANPYIGPSFSITEKEFDKIFETNVKNTFYTIVDFLDLLKKGKNSTIVILSSHAGYTPFPNMGVYSISKSALFTMTKVLAEELSKYKIRVNCVAVGFTKQRLSFPIIHNIYVEGNFMKRNSLPHEIAGIAQFLASDDSSYINGEVVSVNGGMRGRL
jgi:dehydrogenase/reductase SDR family protein 4